MAENYNNIHIEFYNNSRVPKKITYALDNYSHNLSGPAVIMYYESGKVRFHYYKINGLIHRKGAKPAIIEFYENGNIKEERYFKYGEKRAKEGKHKVRYDEEGNELN